MSFFREGWRELRRKFRRQKNRVLLEAKRKRLAEAEIRLGSLCVDEAGTVEALRQPVKEVTSLHAQKEERQAELDAARRRLDAARASLEQGRSSHQDALKRLQEERTPLLEERNICKGKLRAFEAEVTECHRKLRSLENAQARQDKIARKQADTAPAHDATPGAQQASISEAPPAVDPERLNIEQASSQAEERIGPLQAELKGYEERIARFDEQIKRLNEEWNRDDKGQLQSIQPQEQSIKKLEEALLEIETQRAEPFRLIGRYAADHPDIARHRPEELGTVQQLREEIDVTRSENESLALESSEVDQQDVRKFYFVLVSLLTIFFAALLLVLRPEPPSVYLPAETAALVSVNLRNLPTPNLKEVPGPEAWIFALAKPAAAFGLPTGEGALTVAMPADGTPEQSGGMPWRILSMPSMTGPKTLEWVSRAPGTRENLAGLTILEAHGSTLTAVGPGMFAFGARADVELLARSRLGLTPDLVTESPPFNVFSQLSSNFDFRAATNATSPLAERWKHLLGPDWFEGLEAVAVGVAFREDRARVRFILGAPNANQARALAEKITAAPADYFTVKGHPSPLTNVPPSIKRHRHLLEIQIDVETARVLDLLGRLTSPPETVPEMAGSSLPAVPAS